MVRPLNELTQLNIENKVEFTRNALDYSVIKFVQRDLIMGTVYFILIAVIEMSNQFSLLPDVIEDLSDKDHNKDVKEMEE